MPAVSDMVGSLGCPLASCEAEEGESVPARPGHLRGNGTERAVVPALILEPVDEHLHGDSAAAVLAFQHRARPWDAPIPARADAAVGRRTGTVSNQEVLRRQHPHIGIVRAPFRTFPCHLPGAALDNAMQA